MSVLKASLALSCCLPSSPSLPACPWRWWCCPQTFTFAGLRVSFSALEVNEPDKVMAQAAGIITELRLLKKVPHSPITMPL